MRKIFSLLLVLAFSNALLFAQYDVSVTTISVWVNATDDSGKPVEGLTADDFEVFEDGKKVPVTCFETSAPETPQATSTAPSETPSESPPKKIAIYLDLYNMSGQEFQAIRPRIREFLKQIGSKKWEVMLAALLPNGKLGIVAPFTTEVNAVSQALMKAPTNAQRDAQSKARQTQLPLVLEGVLEIDPRVQEAAFQNAMSVVRSYADEERNSSKFSLAALGSFTNNLAKRESTEHVVVLFVSGGINLDPGRVYYDMAMRVADALGYTSDPIAYGFLFSANRESTNDLKEELKKNVGKLNRNNVTVYAVNTRGLYTQDNTQRSSSIIRNDPTLFQDFQDSMIQLAEETGGLSFDNSQNFKVGFEGILTDLGQQYLLCFTPPEHSKPREYHKIKVVTKKKDVNLRFRKGYLDE